MRRAMNDQRALTSWIGRTRDILGKEHPLANQVDLRKQLSSHVSDHRVVRNNERKPGPSEPRLYFIRASTGLPSSILLRHVPGKIGIVGGLDLRVPDIGTPELRDPGFA